MSRSVPHLKSYYEISGLGRVMRLGLATRGNTSLDREDVTEAVRRGVNYLNWCGHPDGLRDAVRKLGSLRNRIFVAVQFFARTARAAERELSELMGELGTVYLDVVTYYYVEQEEEWEQIVSPGGAAEVLEKARNERTVRTIGLTSHQRDLAAKIAGSGRLDLLMVRYNAAHRGVEKSIFPLLDERRLPAVVFTCLRWGALLESTPEDPAEFSIPAAKDWYRFALAHRSVAVALMAPNGRRELEENLCILDDWQGFTAEEYGVLKAHGDRVRRHAGNFL